MIDQYTLQNPTTQYPKSGQEFQQKQPGPGLEQNMHPKPDAGEQTYRGSGRLTGRLWERTILQKMKLPIVSWKLPRNRFQPVTHRPGQLLIVGQALF